MGLPSCGGGPPQCRARFRAAYAASALTVLCLAVKGPLGFTQPMKGGQLESQPRQLVTTRAELTEVGPAELEAAIRSGPVVLDVYAVWCGPCKMLEPTLEKLAEQLSAFEEEGLQVPQVLRMDSDQHSAKATSLGVEGLPTVIFFKGGAEVARLEGAVGLSQLEEEAAAAFGMELAGEESVMQLVTMAELELLVQVEDVLVLGVLGGGKWEQGSASLDATLQLLCRQFGQRVQVAMTDASKVPGVAESLQLGDLPAVVLFQEGSKVMQLEGPDAAAVRVEELEDLLSEAMD
ncbi:unnamed protein product [Effrenium voratum]|nr:unnamed protein product [Effrenium voratum]CAJ1415988.1 unnamed protein product [Effrenium voratum]